MNFPKLPEKLTHFVGKMLLKGKKISPEVCVVGGMLCGGAALVMVGVKTFKNKETVVSDLDSIRAITHDTKEEIITDAKEGEPQNGVKVTLVKKETLTDTEKKQLWARRIDFGKDLVKIYWIPGVLAVGSAGLVWGGRTMLRKELSTVTLAYATLLETYSKYRKRVAEVIGEDKEQQLAAGYKMVEHVDEATGKVETVPEVIDPQANLSQYGFWFNEGYFDKEKGEWAWRNFNHDRNKLANRILVKNIEEETTRRIRTIGYAWLEDVALKFGLDPDEARKFHDIGWVWKEGSENRAEFGVLESKWQLPVNKGFCDDRCSQNVCFINPNVDGYIGYIRDDYKKYDMRYGKGEKHYKSLKREFNNVINRYNEESMEHMVFDAMSPRGKRRIIGAE